MGPTGTDPELIGCDMKDQEGYIAEERGGGGGSSPIFIDQVLRLCTDRNTQLNPKVHIGPDASKSLSC